MKLVIKPRKIKSGWSRSRARSSCKTGLKLSISKFVTQVPAVMTEANSQRHTISLLLSNGYEDIAQGLRLASWDIRIVMIVAQVVLKCFVLLQSLEDHSPLSHAPTYLTVPNTLALQVWLIIPYSASPRWLSPNAC